MDILNNHNGFYVDLYELTMAQGYFYAGKKDEPAAFDYFFRDNPFGGGYVIFAGLWDLLKSLENFLFNQDDIEYLRKLGFRDEFLEYLRDFQFRGTITSMREGEVVFPVEPVLRVEGTIIECQLIETLLLNYLNFESLIATKASRIRRVAGERPVSDFGLRRAQGLGGLQASRAAIIGGVNATSNVLAGYTYNVATTGTIAHSWVQSFDDELTAFRQYAEVSPQNTVLLVDTYNTLNQGIPNAIRVGHELKQKGYQLKAIRLDSGDLAYLSKKARIMLDKAGLNKTKILASNQLDEYVIRSLLEQGAPIDGFGVGTELITGKKTAALDGVYKLSMNNHEPKLKLSDTYEKISLPGLKKVFRFFDHQGFFYADCIALEDETDPEVMHHPYEMNKNLRLTDLTKEPLYHRVFAEGKIVAPKRDTLAIQKYARQRLKQLPVEHQRFEMPHIYKVGISERLNHMRNKIIQKLRKSS
ncbi:MAG TPA: nicotinate phosphoribosyltransferase [Bacteroidales bacterium]|nr:nicotinate phosphoribosyltransferase [Bacteroidales bacterium]